MSLTIESEKRISDAIANVKNFVDDSHLIESDLATKAIHTGYQAFEYKGCGNPIVPPICLSTTFKQKDPGNPEKSDYTRGGNQNREILQDTLAALEGGKHCCVFASGMATLMSISQMLKSGDEILYFEDVYGGTNRYMKSFMPNVGINAVLCDMRNIGAFEECLNNHPKTKLVWLETPSNPLMRLVDIEAIVKITKAKSPDILVSVDNTFLTPCFQNPLKFGADIVTHSITKYLNGHTDVLMGAAIYNSDELHKKLYYVQYAAGAVPSPFDCYLVTRSLRSLTCRMRQHQASSVAVGLFLESHPRVEKVLHPLLPSHPQYELSKRQTKGSSGMVSFYIKADLKQTTKFMNNVKILQLAESLGGYESLLEVPSVMTHASVPEEERKKLGLTDNLVRLSIGLEDVRSILQDLDQALNSLD